MKRDNVKVRPESRSEGFYSEPTTEGTLEISSTGYGLESASKEEASHRENSSGCGGL
jgi:hypothetical protein